MKEQTRAPHGAVRRIASLGVAVLAAIGLSLGAAAPALAHDELTGRTFTNGTDGAVDGVVLSYSNEIMPVGTEIVVTDAAGNSVTKDAPEIAGRDVTQALVTPLKTGANEEYHVIWRVVSSDGHPIQGEYYFAVNESGVAEITASVEPDPRLEGEDENVEDEVATTDSASAEQSSFPVGGWIAIVAVVVLGAAAAVLFATKKRKTADDAAKTNDVEETN